jgi:hypothetical protein
MSLWRRLFSKPKEEAQISLSEAFPLTETDGLSEVEIDEAVLEARSEPDEGVDEESMPEPLPPIVEDELASVAGPSTDETEDLQSLESQSIPQGPSIEMPKSSGSRPMPNLGSIRKGKNPSTSQVLSSQDVGQGAPIDSESDDVLSELPDSHDHLEDLSSVDGQTLPELQVPDWRQELEFAKDRFEPCDLTNHIVKVSKRRFVARRIDFELAHSRKNAYQRFLERATRRFKEKIDEDKVLNDALRDLSQWKSQQSFSVSWRLAERINEEVFKAKQAENEAVAFVQNNTEFTNPEAVEQYRHFVRRVLLIPVVTLYLGSVIGLTYNRFEWILKFIPPFNLGLRSTLVMVMGVASGFWLSNLWRYAKRVSRVNKQAEAFEKIYREQEKKIVHAVAEHTRLSQQQPLVEPILQVLAKAYRVQLQSDTNVRAHATTFFDPSSLPACVTLARAEDNDEIKMAKLKRRALSVLMKPGWRTDGLDRIARIHADSRMLDSNSLSLKSLDTDSLVSARNAQRVLLEAFSNRDIHERVSKQRLREAIQNLHSEVLAKWESSDRPTVVSLRDDGFNRLSFRSSWLDEQDISEDWIDFLSEILEEETSPFGIFNIQDKTSDLNKKELISSVAVVPHYFEIKDSRVKVEHSPVKDVLPMDVVVRVDVSPWANPSAFAVFANERVLDNRHSNFNLLDDVGGDTSV